MSTETHKPQAQKPLYLKHTNVGHTNGQTQMGVYRVAPQLKSTMDNIFPLHPMCACVQTGELGPMQNVMNLKIPSGRKVKEIERGKTPLLSQTSTICAIRKII